MARNRRCGGHPHDAMLDTLFAVIIAGGSGTRFWPLSTPERPKQFISLFGERSMLQMTRDRLRDLAAPERTIVITAERHVELAREQLPELPPENIIGEPQARDTAAAVALGAAICRARHGDATMLVLPADHLISPLERFEAVITAAAEAAPGSGSLYTFGIVPDFPATGYGYLELGELASEADGIAHHALRRFKEKPDADTAERFLATGGYLWNSGMFLWQAETIWSQIARHLPAHAEAIGAAVSDRPLAEWRPALAKALATLPKVSIDVGVMEKAERVRTIKADLEWSDVGGWLAVEKFFEPQHPNMRGQGNLYAFQAENCFSLCEDPNEIVACVGVSDLVIIRSEHRTLVADRNYVEKMKSLIEHINAEEAKRKE